jgi:hypothetical protein
MVLGPLTFLAPLALLGLLALPIIWWILRITPPQPLETVFPPLRLLYDIEKEEETPRSTPPWLLLFRLLLGALIAIALAKPILFNQASETSRPLVLVVDNGWAAAGNWPAIARETEALIKQSVSENKMVSIIATADPLSTENAAMIPASEAFKQARSLQPTVYAPDRQKVVDRLKSVDLTKSDVFWLSDGVDYGNAAALRDRLNDAAQTRVFLPNTEISPLLGGAAIESANGFRNEWHRLDTSSLRTHTISAFGPQGRVIGRTQLQFSPGERTAEASFELPAELRNQVSLLRPEGFSSAGAVTLLDDSWGRPLVGLLSGSDANAQPLLSEWHYIEKALAPSADIYKGDLGQLTAVSPSIIFMTDRARTESEALEKYVEDGGMLIRFAGPKLAKRADNLLPVPLRAGGRDLGGALAWEEPQQIAAFAEDSPFFGLSIAEEVVVKKQIMAQPGTETDARTWARLQDGSPVITSAPQGLGRVVLFHVTAGPDWSELPLSGLYVEMLKRLLPLARSTSVSTGSSQGDWTAERSLDGYGQLGKPPANAQTIANDAFASTKASFENPPGLYRQGLRRQALNTVKSPDDYQLLDAGSIGVAPYGGQKPKSLSGLLLGIAAAMMVLDAFLSLIASGRLREFNPGKTVTSVLVIGLALAVTAPFDAQAQEADAAHRDALDLHLAYVITGNDQIDRMSKAGLEGLAQELTRRTTIEPAGVRGVTIGKDQLAYYPFLYWPIQRNETPLTDAENVALNAYMASGGTIVMDTQDQEGRRLLGNQTHPGLATVSGSLDIPRLAYPPSDHVITKSFYLIQVYPGRWADGKIWVEADQRGSARDGVSSVIVGSNDWSAAWAKDDEGRSLAVIETDIPRQREIAYRWGVNLAMYALSGNYKADQVHAAILVERMGKNENTDLVPPKDVQEENRRREEERLKEREE